jgi:WS/DGAT/MGAT family acyltransferase
MWLVEGLARGRFAAVAKMHNSMVDGAAGVNLLTLLLRPNADDRIEPSPIFKPRPAPSRFQLLVDESAQRMAVPSELWRRAGRLVRSPREALAGLVERGSSVLEALNAALSPPAKTPLNRPIGPHRRFAWHEIELDRVRRLRHHLDGTINDVILTVVAGALRSFLLRRGASLEGYDYRVMVPVDMRRPDEDPGAADRVSGVFLSLPVEEPVARKRLESIVREMRQVKESRAAEGITLFTDFADWTGSTLLLRAGVELASRVQPYNMIVTNVPGPQAPFYLLGSRLLALYPQLPLFHNQGLGVAVLSYSGKICWGLVGDWDLVPDLTSFPLAIEASVQELEAVATRG